MVSCFFIEVLLVKAMACEVQVIFIATCNAVTVEEDGGGGSLGE